MTAKSNLRHFWLAQNGVPAEGQSLSGRASGPDYRIDPETGCWEWQRFKFKGYGRHAFVGHNQYAHRAYYEAAYGPVPEGYHVHHRCENPGCVNPEHLEPKTHSAHLTLHKQADSALSWDDVRAIRAQAWEGESVGVLAERWGLSLGTIHPLIVGRTWKDPEYTRPTWTKECRECGDPFETHRPGKEFCSVEHRYRFNNRKGWARRSAA